MLRFSCLTLGEYRIVLDQPDFIKGTIIAGIGEFMHSLGDWLVRLKTELADKNFILIQNCISVENE
ncbi:Uncharacterised protein [Shigella sonnei]|nr:Uncharacterised protein [Shigella sonnei]